MRFLHIADLHFGKNLGGLSLVEKDQPAWVASFLEKVRELKPDAVVISGDVYDRSSPSSEAVRLFNDMITSLNELNVEVLMVSGNHDSGDRLAFAERILEKEKLHIAGRIEKQIKKVTLTDEYGKVNFYLLPYCFPGGIAQILEDDGIRDYDTAVRRIIEAQHPDFSERNVLAAHQNVLANGTAAERGGSETMVGGVGEIDCSAFDGFDYTALGHIHAGQRMGRETVRYAGSPLCYHFQETKHPNKGCLLVTMGRKGDVRIETIKIEPLHELRVLEGTYDEILSLIAALERPCYLRTVFTDKRLTAEITEAVRNAAEQRGSRVLESDTKAFASGNTAIARTAGDMKAKPMDRLFLEFCMERFEEEPGDEDMKLVREAMNKAMAAAKIDVKPDEDDDAKALAQMALDREA